MPRKFYQSGIIHLWLILLLIGIILGVVFLGSQFKPWIKPSIPAGQQSIVPTVTVEPSLPANSPTGTQVNTSDFEALEKYCMEEALKLPEAPFTYESKTGPLRSGPMPWVDQFIPKDKKQSEKKSCSMSYRFAGRTAYGEMGVEYPGQGREFDKRVRASLTSKIDSSWRKVSGPNISEDGFNMVYKRENSQKGTVDYLDVFDGGATLFIKFNTYYK